MTREEASYILRKFYADGYKSNNYNTLEQALKIAVICIENLPHWISVEFPHWISVEDELPPLKQRVLIYDEDEDVMIVDERQEDYYNNSGTNTGWEWSSELDPTYWMPLPQAPKGGGRSAQSQLKDWMRL